MKSEILYKTTAAGFRVSYLADAKTDWLALFEKLRGELAAGKDGEWQLLQRTECEGKFIRRTWRVDAEADGRSVPVIFKSETISRVWSLDRVLRGFRARAGSLLERIERARAAGFTFPMRIFLAAERYELGMLRERFLLCEFIDGKNAGRGPERDRAVVEAVRRAHAFGLGWGGDPDPRGRNILVDMDGNLRGVDISPYRATWRMRGKDLNFFYDAGMLAGTPPLNVRVARLQAAFKNLLRKGRQKRRKDILGKN